MEFKIIENHPNDSRVKYRQDGIFQTLSSRMGTGGGNVPMVQTIAIGIGQQGGKGQANYAIEKSPTLAAESHGTPHAVCYSKGHDERMDDYKGANNQYVDQDKCIVNNKTVRRLVPLECERLQGLPDSWTDVEYNGKSAPDSKRYKAIGNGMAVPCSDFIMRRIAEVNTNGQNQGHD